MANYNTVAGVLNTQAVSTTYKYGVRFRKKDATTTLTNTPNTTAIAVNGIVLTGDTAGINASPMILAQSTSLPKRFNEPISWTLSGIPMKQPGRSVPSQDITLQFIETLNMPLHILKRILREYVWSPSQGRNPQNAFFDVYLNKLKPTVAEGATDLISNSIWIYKLVNCFLQDDDSPTLDGNSNEPEIITLTIGFENFTEGPPGSTGTIDPNLGVAVVLA